MTWMLPERVYTLGELPTEGVCPMLQFLYAQASRLVFGPGTSQAAVHLAGCRFSIG